jgi:hypothetical protein
MATVFTVLCSVRGCVLMLKKEFFGAFAKLKKKRPLASFGLFVRLSVCMEEFGLHWTIFHEI